MTTSNWSDVASQIASLEQDGMQVSADWYEFEPIRRQDAEKLLKLHNDSLSKLNKLSSDLDTWLRGSPVHHHRENAQYAYQLTQELIQSRQANIELLQNVLTNTEAGHPEFGRALALKERAAAEQAEQLQKTIRRIQ